MPKLAQLLGWHSYSIYFLSLMCLSHGVLCGARDTQQCLQCPLRWAPQATLQLPGSHLNTNFNFRKLHPKRHFTFDYTVTVSAGTQLPGSPLSTPFLIKRKLQEVGLARFLFNNLVTVFLPSYGEYVIEYFNGYFIQMFSVIASFIWAVPPLTLCHIKLMHSMKTGCKSELILLF